MGTTHQRVCDGVSASALGRAVLALAPVCAFGLLASSCQPGGITIRVLLTEGSDAQLHDLFYASVTATRVETGPDEDEREAPEQRTGSGTSLDDLALRDLPSGPWQFRIEAFDEEYRLLLQGQTQQVEVARGEETTVNVILAPPESIMPLPLVSGLAEAETIASRYGLTATTAPDRDGRAVVVVAGGGDGLVEATRDAWIYHPEQVAFERIAQMRCPRSGHSAIPLDLSDGAHVVLLAGGGAAPCEGGAGRTSANSMEVFDPASGAFRFFDPEWDFSPDLSGAQVVPLAGGRFFLLADGMAWDLDIEHPEQVVEILDHPMPGTSQRIVPLDQERRVAVVGARSDELTVMVFDEGGICGHSSLNQVVEEGFSVTALPSGRLLVMSGDQWWVVITSECHVVSSELFRGTHAPPRLHHTTTALDDQRLLVVGGQQDDSVGQASIFLPESLSSIAQFIRPGPLATHRGTGHAVAALPDGTALILGGGGGAEVFNPRRGAGEIVGAFDGRYRIEDDDLTRMVLVVDSTDDGGRLRRTLAETALNMLARPLGVELVPAVGSAIGVVSSDRGVLRFRADDCDPGPREWGWEYCLTSEDAVPDAFEGVIPGDEPGLEGTLQCRIVDSGWSPDRDRCPVRQHLAVVSGLMGQLETGAGHYVESLGLHPGSLVFVLAVAGEDCSEDPGYHGPDVEFDPYGCHRSDGLIDPEALAQRILDFSRDRYRIEVVVLYGAPYEEFCALPSRFERLVDALGDQGYAFSACNADEQDEASARVQNVARALAYRTVCLQPGASFAPRTCQVYASWKENEEEWIVPRVFSRDWSFLPEAAECAQTEGASWDAFELTTTCGGAPDGLFQRFYYLCW